MSSSHRSRIIVTPRGVDMQLQLVKDQGLTSSEVPSPKLSLSPRHPKNSRSISISSQLPPYFFPTRPGYFGPKGPQFSTQSTKQSPSQSVSKEYSLYPNYLKRDAKEYPQKHMCVWKPKSTIKETEKMPQEKPLGKYLHHTLYSDINSSPTKFIESPKMDQLNTMVFGKALPLTINLTSTEFRNWGQKSVDNEMQKSTISLQATQTNFYSPRLASTGFSKFTVSSQKDLEAKDERVLKKHIENEKNYQKLLIRFDEEAKRKFNRYQENQHEAPEFEKKMKEEHKNLQELDHVKFNEDARFTARLKTLQKKKYEGIWTKHDWFYEKNNLLSNREVKTAKKEDEVSVSGTFNSARDTNRLSAKEGEKSMRVDPMTLSKKTSMAERFIRTDTFAKKASMCESEGEKNRPVEVKRNIDNVIVKRKVELK